MKNSILFIAFVSFSSILLGQVYEVGVSLGGSNYVGDIGRTNYIYPNRPAGAAFFKYNWNPRIALRGTYSYLPIQGDDEDADTDFKQNRGLNFKNTIHELAIGMEYNFYEFDMSSKDKTWTPYILVELAAFKYKSAQSEPQPNEYFFTNKTSYAVPIGVGFKSKLYGTLAFSLEAKFRYTFVDDLDYSTPSIPSLDFGGNGNDWYMFTGFSLIYTFGRPACYTEGL
ncbi:outer membrane beta-barrel protein [Polaribacter haliotis]|uniref:Outer membrane beta-barrel protein n=1 Tax=Polaribacter haliotis TaxID=1888915 RepID=A0A7L8AEU9_9FLAO|nr:DUF6089 family protein [Polaribacter haliotis]QOD60512.1 outer membrane beta-barrel protein [Polaribacter haliotis]